jgi:hypothetical protein
MARLKVFTWSDGLHAYSVAATSRPKALEAWGIGRDIFADGTAREITDGEDHDAALARPGEVIRRPLPIDPKVLGPPKAKTPAKGASRPPARKPKAGSSPSTPATATRRGAPSPAVARARAAVAQMEAQLEAQDRADAEALEAFGRRRAALEREGAALRERQARDRARLVDRLKAARRKL